MDLFSHLIDGVCNLIQFIPASAVLREKNPVIQFAFTNGSGSLTDFIHFIPEGTAVKINRRKSQNRTHEKDQKNPGSCQSRFFIITPTVRKQLKLTAVGSIVFHKKLFFQIYGSHIFTDQFLIIGGLDFSSIIQKHHDDLFISQAQHLIQIIFCYFHIHKYLILT